MSVRTAAIEASAGLPVAGPVVRHPQWYLNLTANPAVEIEIGRRRSAYRARTASRDERARLWPRLVDMYADYATYQSWTEREIPVVICEPLD